MQGGSKVRSLVILIPPILSGCAFGLAPNPGLLIASIVVLISMAPSVLLIERFGARLTRPFHGWLLLVASSLALAGLGSGLGNFSFVVFFGVSSLIPFLATRRKILLSWPGGNISAGAAAFGAGMLLGRAGEGTNLPVYAMLYSAGVAAALVLVMKPLPEESLPSPRGVVPPTLFFPLLGFAAGLTELLFFSSGRGLDYAIFYTVAAVAAGPILASTGPRRGLFLGLTIATAGFFWDGILYLSRFPVSPFTAGIAVPFIISSVSFRTPADQTLPSNSLFFFSRISGWIAGMVIFSEVEIFPELLLGLSVPYLAAYYLSRSARVIPAGGGSIGGEGP